MHRKTFEEYLREQNLSDNTCRSYLQTIDFYKKNFHHFDKKNLLSYKEFLCQNYKSGTVNLRIIAINRYLSFIGKKNSSLKSVKVQQRSFLENVITQNDYEILKTELKKNGQEKWYFVVRFLGSTGVRISELLLLRAEDVLCGHADICSKGKKTRRIYIPAELRNEALAWLESRDYMHGRLFLNRFGNPISARGVSFQLKKFAELYGIDRYRVHPHSFRHLFAKNFLEKSNDIAFLADFLGHESIETTRIYLRKSSDEQKNFVDSVVTW